MKKVLIMFIALVMVFTMADVAFAAGGAKSKGITAAKAKAIALKSAKLKPSAVKNMKVKLEKKNGQYEVSFVRKKNKAKYDFDIQYTNGRLLGKEITYRYCACKSKKKIGKRCAMKKAAKYMRISVQTIQKGGGKVKYVREDGVGKYEVKYRKGHYKYEIEMLARNGKITEFEFDYLKR